ncbi:AcsL2 [Desulforapulum autotrophicum HRM2]|uniref:AcsL2 n=1 Tax=Desulforapulum autotrophicum (strain ATCC 43914 / DSM 3382 / VKM B-1955 / HRM2) TaxID=177437 RepID=C0QL26_DESAH|nr:AMP-binding protein [Desulforapulum autotrophicum]ACN14112.1 AcsL2 [Desulforapulum autotrophicum HRM2]
MQKPEIKVGETTIGNIVDILAENIGDNSGLEYNSLGIKYTFKEFRGVCDKVAKGLMALGIQRGEKIAIWANNVPEWVYTQYGSARMGAVLVTVNTSYKSAELEYLLEQSDSTTLILMGGVRTPDEYIKTINKVCPELKDSEPGKTKCKKLPFLKNLIYLGKDKIPGMYNWDEIMEMGKAVSDDDLQKRLASLEPDDVINMQYTSGTTGFPKGVMLSHTNLIGNAKSMAECMNLTPDDAMCIPVPFFHCFGCVIGTLCCMVSGATMAPVVAFNPVDTLKTVESSKCNALLGVPTMFIAEFEEMDKHSYDTSSLRTGVMAGSTCPVEVMKRVIKDMGAKEMTIVYGQTEASPGITQTRDHDSLEIKTSTVGCALPNVEVKIVDPVTGDEMPRGKQGELCSRGYHVMKGYYKMEEATKNTIDKDGWLHTGDLAEMDENGYCKITGRIKDMIIRGGENIYPREIEEFLYTHPKVKDVQVVGIPSEKYGEEVAAFIQVRPGDKSTAEEIKEFCKDQISYHKIPKHIFFVDEYPTTASGKIQKYKLRDSATKELKKSGEVLI